MAKHRGLQLRFNRFCRVYVAQASMKLSERHSDHSHPCPWQSLKHPDELNRSLSSCDPRLEEPYAPECTVLASEVCFPNPIPLEPHVVFRTPKAGCLCVSHLQHRLQSLSWPVSSLRAPADHGDHHCPCPWPSS